MDETTEMAQDMKDFETRLSAGMHALVDGEAPAPELRERIFDGLDSAPGSRRRWLPAAAAALLVVAAIGAIVGLGNGDGGSVDVATDPDPDIEVAGVTDERDDASESDVDDTTETTTSTTTAPAAPDDEATPPEGGAAPAPAPAPSGTESPATTSPPTTALTCQNSTNPDCGPFHWSPEPTNRAATLQLSVPDRIVAGESFDIGMTMSDPDGPVTLQSYVVNGPDVAIGATSVSNEPCPERYGPWTPPAPEAGQASTHTNAQFNEPGSYVITVHVDPAQGCDNVNPYRSGATAEIAVEVVEG